MNYRLFPAQLVATLIAILLATNSHAAERPNILLIVSDDLGYTDLGAFGGSDLKTPNLDALAESGLRFANFHNSPSCAPTRAMLMTGAYNHAVGLAEMNELQPLVGERAPGFEGYLIDRALTVAELLQASGYNTLMTGKWHLGGDFDNGPWAQGFDRSFTSIHGWHNHFGAEPVAPAGVWDYSTTPYHWENGYPVEKMPDNFYSSDHFTQKLVQYIHESGRDEPFFGYLNFTAPHWPLMAPKEVIQQYIGRYDEGYEVLFEQRKENMIKLGLISEAARDRQFPEDVPRWNSLSKDQQDYYARAMEIYASMIEIMDWNIGRLLEFLRRTGRYDNTLIIFMSDNGPDSSSAYSGFFTEFLKRIDDDLDEMGSEDSYVLRGPGWAHASSAGLQGVKSSGYEGGHRVPLIVSGAGVDPKLAGSISQAMATGRDILPTLVQLAGVTLSSETYKAQNAPEVTGVSLLPVLTGESKTVHSEDEVFVWEISGARSVQRGAWKIVSGKKSKYRKEGQWGLFNLANDPSESHDLAMQQPKILASLISEWEQYALEHNIQP